jgi:hypothetical protein
MPPLASRRVEAITNVASTAKAPLFGQRLTITNTRSLPRDLQRTELQGSCLFAIGAAGVSAEAEGFLGLGNGSGARGSTPPLPRTCKEFLTRQVEGSVSLGPVAGQGISSPASGGTLGMRAIIFSNSFKSARSARELR